MNDKNLQNWICQVDENCREKQRRQHAENREDIPVKAQTELKPIEAHLFDPAWFKKADRSS